MANETVREENIEKLREMIKDIEIAMLTTVEPDGTLRSRPMATQQTDFDGDLYFFTREHSGKVAEIEQDRHVNVAYAKPDDQRYVSVSGKARLIRDKQKIDELWSPALKAWFPNGKDDPELALLKVTVEQAEYWDAPSGFIANTISFAKAIAAGTTAHPGENEKLNLKQAGGES